MTIAPISHSRQDQTKQKHQARNGYVPRWLVLIAIWSLVPLIAIGFGGDTVHAQTFNFDLGDGPGVTSSGRMIQ
ncbi:MAG TPA: flagellar biosynthetic protein FliP, partial [Thalassospira sp.]|nr:flagellar biosynthetic protein FliP [Thalassospira sp.]